MSATPMPATRCELCPEAPAGTWPWAATGGLCVPALCSETPLSCHQSQGLGCQADTAHSHPSLQPQTEPAPPEGPPGCFSPLPHSRAAPSPAGQPPAGRRKVTEVQRGVFYSQQLNWVLSAMSAATAEGQQMEAGQRGSGSQPVPLLCAAATRVARACADGLRHRRPLCTPLSVALRPPGPVLSHCPERGGQGPRPSPPVRHSLVLDEGVFVDGLDDVSEQDLGGQSVAVVHDGLPVGPVPAVHCGQRPGSAPAAMPRDPQPANPRPARERPSSPCEGRGRTPCPGTLHRTRQPQPGPALG